MQHPPRRRPQPPLRTSATRCAISNDNPAPQPPCAHGPRHASLESRPWGCPGRALVARRMSLRGLLQLRIGASMPWVIAGTLLLLLVGLYLAQLRETRALRAVVKSLTEEQSCAREREESEYVRRDA